MINTSAEAKPNKIKVQRREIDIVLNDKGAKSLTISFPPIDEIENIHNAAVITKPPKEVSTDHLGCINEQLEAELESYSKKYQRFKTSPTFLSRAASLSALSEKFDTAEALCKEGMTTKYKPRFVNQLAHIYILQQQNNKAKDILASDDVREDVSANLRLCYLHIKENAIGAAEECLGRVLSKDSLNYGARMFLAGLHLRSGQYEKALRSLRVASTENPRSSLLHVNLALTNYFLGHKRKAIKELKTAISLNPVNENALSFYADLLFAEKRPQDAIPPLEKYIKLRQPTEVILDRLGRSYYLAGLNDRAISIFQQQMRASNNYGVWNNFGLALWGKGEREKAIRAIVKSIKMAGDNIPDSIIPFLNLLCILNDRHKFNVAYKFSKEIFKMDINALDHNAVSKILIQYIISVTGLQRYEDAIFESEKLLKLPFVDHNFKTMIYTNMLHLTAAKQCDVASVIKFCDDALNVLREGQNISEENRILLLNNIVFALLYYGEIERASIAIKRINPYFHKDPICTATLGLYNLKHGRIERAKELYEESILLTNDKNLKLKIRQRMDLEIGKYYLSRFDRRNAQKHLTRAATEKVGFQFARDEASRVLKTLLHH